STTPSGISREVSNDPRCAAMCAWEHIEGGDRPHTDQQFTADPWRPRRGTAAIMEAQYMSVDFHNPLIELDRSHDHGRPSVIAPSAIVARLIDAAAPASTRENATGDWCRRLGAIHRRRDEAARLGARGNEERTHAR